MAEPGTTGEAIQIVRRVLYDLARQSGWNRDGATQAEIITFAVKRDWKVPITDFERAIGRHLQVGTAEWIRPPGTTNPVAEDRYRLTVRGDLEEEDFRRAEVESRRPLREKVIDELRKPPRIVDLAYLVAGIVLSLIAQIVVEALGLRAR